jgi:hypothetical protein
MSDNKETTTVSQVEIEDLDTVLGTPGAENIMLPEEKKPNVFSSKPVDLAFIDKEEDDDTSSNDNPDEGDNKTSTSKPVDLSVLDEDLMNNDDSDGTKTTSGRPRTDKNGTVELVKKMIEAGKLIPFEDDKPIEDYTIKDYEELLEANFAEKERLVRERTPEEFFSALPDELQVAAKYVADGGQDLRGLFKVLSQVEETRSLDADNTQDQEQIVREYLRATNFGSADEIEEEIEGWKDSNVIDAKAKKFKPKLDAMQEHVVAQKLAEQEKFKRQQQAQAQHYMNSVYETLKPGELNGLKLDRKTQEFLYSGLVQPSYPSISGRATNLLGHLLEKHQFVEPNHGLIAEALWLLADPDGYRTRIKEQGEKKANEKTARMLKTEEAKRQTSTPVIEKEETRQRTIPRTGNFFKR